MKKIVISEFMDKRAADSLKDGFSVVFDPTLVNRPDDLLEEIRDADAVIVRNRTQVRGGCWRLPENLKPWAGWGLGWTTSTLRPAGKKGSGFFPPPVQMMWLLPNM